VSAKKALHALPAIMITKQCKEVGSGWMHSLCRQHGLRQGQQVSSGLGLWMMLPVHVYMPLTAHCIGNAKVKHHPTKHGELFSK
jgi:hypothetical protein